MGEKVRMVDIAAKAGVTAATVSMALRDHPDISEATKLRIRKICSEMNYTPNPAAKALRESNKGNQYLGTLAMLEYEELFERHTASPLFSQWVAKLTALCKNMGYKLDRFPVGSTQKKQKTLNRILQARGITGLFIWGHGEPVQTWALDWDHFAAVISFGSLHEHFLHNVMSSSYQDIYEATLLLHHRNYRRVGYIINRPFDHWAAGVHAAVQEYMNTDSIPDLILTDSLNDPDETRSKLLQWLDRYHPDVLVTQDTPWLLKILAEENLRIPQDIGLLCLDVWPTDLQVSGLIQQREAANQVAISFLHSMLAQHELGAPEYPICVQIPSRWNEGTTLRTP